MFQRLAIIVLCGLGFLGCNKQSFVNPDQVEQFSQEPEYNSKVDLLILSDDSISMDKHQLRLNEQIPGLVENLDSQGVDYRIAVTTTSLEAKGKGGQFVGATKYLKKDSPNLVEDLKSRIYSGPTLFSWEEGLESIHRLLQKDKNAAESERFLRSDAYLVILALSDEDDYSPQSTSFYFNEINAIKKPFPNGNKSWIFNFIGILSLTESCQAVDQRKEVGVRYIDVAKQSGGLTESLCTRSLAKAVDNVRILISTLATDRVLGQKPIIESIQVWKNGIEVPRSAENGWEYYEQGNLIRFSGAAIPGLQDKVEIKFSPAEAAK